MSSNEYNKSPNDIYFQVDNWIADNIKTSASNQITGPKTKKEWLECFAKNRKLGNVEEGAALAGELFHLVQISRVAMKKYTKELVDLKNQISTLKKTPVECSAIKDMIKKEIGSIVPTIVQQIESKMKGEETSATTTPNEEKHALIIEQKTGTGDTQSFSKLQWSDLLKGTVSEKLNEVPVTKSTLTTDGKGYVTFPSRESRDIAAEALKDDFVVVEKDRNRKTLYPKMKICDLEGYKKTDTDKLRSIIPKKNPRIKKLMDEGAAVDVVFIHEPSTKEFYGGYAVIRVDPRIREEIIKNRRRIYIDTTSYYMKDQIHVTQCFACQSFGHKKGSPHCPLTSTDRHICLYCAGKHLSRACQVKSDQSKHKCSNCLKTHKYRYSANHTTTSSECPIHKKETEGVICRTICDSKNFPIQRVIQRQ